ncbi:hypothetical protein HPB51_011310 [Rhipicephalus microplus]|uniref:Tick transposon n=1 Tax=Rhipicephalus microplus TaxID=6941 RepID=A0A9J6DLZ9_RHIMP|nr:hypothetical protein HPB51_011310 [Rhipicephalus microplus]
MDIKWCTSEQYNLILEADLRFCDAAASLTLAAGTSPVAGVNAALRPGVMEDETTIEHSQVQGEHDQTNPVHVVRRHVSPQTITLRLGTKLHLPKFPTYQVTNAIGVAAVLSASEDIPDDQLLSIITIEDRQILAARRIGDSETILWTVKGATVPMEVKMGMWLTKAQPFRPRAVQCSICLTIGHRADVCPTAHEFTRCETCGQQFPASHQPGRTAHECEVKCFNCEGPHGARDPRCPKKQQADNLARIAAEKRRLKTTRTDSAEPQKSQASQSRQTKPAKKNDQNYPILLLQNRFSALQDSTPDPQPKPRPRSGSLPGFTTKRPTPPPPKPKTPSYLKALLSHKTPTPSEGPPRKQPRQSPSDKVTPSFTPLGRSPTKQHYTSTHSSTPTSSSAAPQVSAPPHYFFAYKTENDIRLETIERQLNLRQKLKDEIQQRSEATSSPRAVA